MNAKNRISFWKRYYYDYLESLVSFLVPVNASVLRIDPDLAARDKMVRLPSEKYDYIVATDVLGHVDDIQAFLDDSAKVVPDDGRIVITQYNALWEPILRLASALGLRKAILEQNWVSMLDLRNFAHLVGLEEVKSGTKMLLPVYIPFVSMFLNRFLANIWPFSRLGILHFIVLRKPQPRTAVMAPRDDAGMLSVGQVGTDRRPSISVIVPARNESGTIKKIANEIPEMGSFTEIIFVEGNSTDNTWEEIQRVAEVSGRKHRIKTARQEGRGKGDAVRKGFEMASGDILAIYDADMTVPPHEMSKFYDAISENRGDFINGSRLVYPLEKESMRVLNFFGNKFFSFAFSAILGQPMKDTLCGTKLIWRVDYDKVRDGRAFFGDFDPFGDFDLLFGAAKLNLKIVDLPIHYKQRVYRTTNISRWKHGWLLLRMTVFASRKMKFI